jgi:hypothetical protein
MASAATFAGSLSSEPVGLGLLFAKLLGELQFASLKLENKLISFGEHLSSPLGFGHLVVAGSNRPISQNRGGKSSLSLGS